MFKIETLPDRPWPHQVAIFSVIVLLVYAGFWYFVASPTHAETAEVNEKVAKLKKDNALAQIASQRLNDFREAYNRAQSDYSDLKALLPEQRELTNVLQGVQDRAHGRLSVRRFTPKEDVQESFYSGKPIEVEVSGSYNNLRSFFADMAGYQRIVSITDFSINPTTEQVAGRTIDAQFLLTAYYVSAEKLQTASAAKPPAAAAASPATPPAK